MRILDVELDLLTTAGVLGLEVGAGLLTFSSTTKPELRRCRFQFSESSTVFGVGLAVGESVVVSEQSVLVSLAEFWLLE